MGTRKTRTGFRSGPVRGLDNNSLKKLSLLLSPALTKLMSAPFPATLFKRGLGGVAVAFPPEGGLSNDITVTLD